MAKLESCCRICGSVTALTRHHLVHRAHAKGLGHNVVTLCSPCHSGVHAKATKVEYSARLRSRLTLRELATVDSWRAGNKGVKQRVLQRSRLDHARLLPRYGAYADEWKQRYGSTA